MKPVKTKDKTVLRSLGLGGYFGGGAEGMVDVKNGKIVRVRPMRYGWKYKKEEVWSMMDEDLLKSIALTTDGAYIPAKTRAYDLGQVYEDHLAGLARGEILEEKRKRYREQFQLFVCLGVAFLLLEMFIPNYPRKRMVWKPEEGSP